MLSGNFDSEVGTAQFALHTLDAGVQVLDYGYKPLHLQYLCRAELNTDLAPLAVLLDNLNRRKFFFHLLSPLVK
jgi:hypothetical protein